jgi:hypothetical protein
MSKLIGIVIILAVIYGGYELWVLWDKYNTGQDLKEEEARKHQVTPEQLPGITPQLEHTYETAQKNGATGIRNWLKAYHTQVQDPRLGWIELDYVIAISQEDPAEAKKVFADVKGRTETNSPVYPRVKELEKTYD